MLSNWQTVLRAIATASSNYPLIYQPMALLTILPAALPRAKKEDDPFTETPEDDGFPKNEEGLSMPQTLVRIPLENQ